VLLPLLLDLLPQLRQLAPQTLALLRQAGPRLLRLLKLPGLAPQLALLRRQLLPQLCLQAPGTPYTQGPGVDPSDEREHRGGRNGWVGKRMNG